MSRAVFYCFLIYLTKYAESSLIKVISITVKPGEVHYIMNPHYPNRVPEDLYVRWSITCVHGHNCVLSCPIFDLHDSTFCHADRFLISNTGDETMFGAQKVCGHLKTLYAQSEDQSMTIGFLSSDTHKIPNKVKGRFICEVSSKPIPGACTCGSVPEVTFKPRVALETGRDVFYKSVVMIAEVVSLRVVCAGTIISQKYVLTAAHCIAKPSAQLAVIYGVFNLQKPEKDRKKYRIDRVLKHPNYNSTSYANDIALLELKGSLPLSSEACLPHKFANVDLTGQNVTAVGYGLAFINRDTLQEIDFDIDDYYPKEKAFWMCSHSHREVCSWQSGGPILYRDPSTESIYMVGLLSYNHFQNHSTYEYDLKVAPYLDWIVSQTLEEYCEY